MFFGEFPTATHGYGDVPRQGVGDIFLHLRVAGETIRERREAFVREAMIAGTLTETYGDQGTQEPVSIK